MCFLKNREVIKRGTHLLFRFQFGCEFEFSTKWDEMIVLAQKAVSTNSKDKLYIPKRKKHFDSRNNVQWH